MFSCSMFCVPFPQIVRKFFIWTLICTRFLVMTRLSAVLSSSQMEQQAKRQCFRTSMPHRCKIQIYLKYEHDGAVSASRSLYSSQYVHILDIFGNTVQDSLFWSEFSLWESQRSNHNRIRLEVFSPARSSLRSVQPAAFMAGSLLVNSREGNYFLVLACMPLLKLYASVSNFYSVEDKAFFWY